MPHLSIESLNADLQLRREQHLYRSRRMVNGSHSTKLNIDGHSVVSFCSNDYLGMANHPKVVKAWQQGANEFGVGSGASHLVSGHNRAHQELEQDLAEFVQRDRALLFSTGYMANLGVVSALLGRGDRIYEDRLNHASLLDAARLSLAQRQRYTHSDVNALAQRLGHNNNKKQLIVSDGVFSMDGDIAPLAQVAKLSRQHNAWLMVDDAHGFGVLGPSGRGSLEHCGLNTDDAPILMATLGKAVGTFGAFVAGSEALIETLIQHARTYVYTTALPPALAHATRTSLQLLNTESWRRYKLNTLIKQFSDGARQLGITLMPSITAIQPVLMGDTEKALRVSEQLLHKGIFVSAIRPPTVPEGSARLRVTLSAEHSPTQVEQLLEALQQTL